MTAVIANDLPFVDRETNPLEALRSAVALSSNDWSSARDFAWIYGIVCGWADEDGDCFDELAAKFGWKAEQVERLKRLHVEYVRAAESWRFVVLRRPRLCEHRLTRPSRLARLWDAVRRHHTRHVCTRQRSFEHEHIGRHVCECGVRWG